MSRACGPGKLVKFFYKVYLAFGPRVRLIHHVPKKLPSETHLYRNTHILWPILSALSKACVLPLASWFAGQHNQFERFKRRDRIYLRATLIYR